VWSKNSRVVFFFFFFPFCLRDESYLLFHAVPSEVAPLRLDTGSSVFVPLLKHLISPRRAAEKTLHGALMCLYLLVCLTMFWHLRNRLFISKREMTKGWWRVWIGSEACGKKTIVAYCKMLCLRLKELIQMCEFRPNKLFQLSDVIHAGAIFQIEESIHDLENSLYHLISYVGLLL